MSFLQKKKDCSSFGVYFLAVCLIAMIQTTLANSATSGTLILYDDPCDPLCLKYIEKLSGEGIDDSDCLLLKPDRWHRPVFWFYRGGGERQDFSPYEVLEFYFRSSEADSGNPTFQLRTWNEDSNLIAISDYIEGGLIDQTWRLVSIPVDDLTTVDWDLGNVERLSWSTDRDKRTYYVDQIRLKSVTPPLLITSGEDIPFPESDRVLRLTFSKLYSHQSAKNLQNYSIRSDSDPAYAADLMPLDSGLQYRVKDFSDSKSAINRYQVFLQFPQPFKNGHTYILEMSNISDPSGNLMAPSSYSFTYNDSTLLNPTIKVNQVGYLPDRPKVGYVGGYLGDLGGAAWSVGENGIIFSWDELNGWNEQASPVTETLYAVSAIRKDYAWATGAAGTLIHWDGTSWEHLQSPTAEDLNAICFGPTNIGWAVGANGTIIRCIEGTWSLIETPTLQTLRAVWAGPNDTAWAVGDGGTILYWDGIEWSIDEQPVTDDLFAIHGPHSDWLWICGANGTVLQHRYSHWNSYPTPLDTPATLHTVVTDENGAVWVGGDDGILWHKPGFGSSSFVAVDSATTETIYALARQHGRQLWGAGDSGSMVERVTGFWEPVDYLGCQHLKGLFALPFGPLRLPDPLPTVSINNAETGQPVLSTALSLRVANWYLSGEDLYSFDFSSLDTPGTYQAYIPGIGLSDPFVIADDVLNYAAYTTARGLYYQRCGTALDSPSAEERFVRPLCHEYNERTIDAAFHSSLPNTPLYGGETSGYQIDAHGGWHDAGDYGKYMPTAAISLWFLFTAYDLDPAKFPDDAFDIPESGNGIPDLLDEARWEVDWITRIQAEDGGVYHKLTAEGWYGDSPHTETEPRFIYEKTTHDTASAAAVLACASRIWAPFDSTVSADYLERAELAWNFLQTHPDTTPPEGFKNPEGTATGEYNDADDTDNRIWAAAELYRTTGKAEYRDYFEQWWANNSHPSGWIQWMHFYKCAYWAYLRADHPDADTSIQQEIRERTIRAGDQLVTATQQNPYHNGARLDVPDWIGWGAFTQGCEYAFPLLQAWALTSNLDYLDAATLNLDAQLGANPLAFSFITGLGARYPKDPLHKVSTYDGVKEPIPGIPVFGVFAHMSNGQPFYLKAQADENSYPQSFGTMDPYPILRRYMDIHELVPMSEFTIVDMAIAASVLNLLSGP